MALAGLMLVTTRSIRADMQGIRADMRDIRAEGHTGAFRSVG